MSKKENKALLDSIKEYNDKQIIIHEIDVEKIKQRYTQYIGYEGERGFLHLIKEVIQNSIDEGMIENALCRIIKIYYNAIDKIVTVTDDGRGIPQDSMEKLITVIQSSGKFTDKNYRRSSGENGVGITAVNALSEWMEVTSTRLGKQKKVRAEHGYVVSSETINIKDIEEHGTVISFKPDEKIIGNCDLNPKIILDWIEIIHYSCKDLVIEFNASNGKTSITKTFHNKNGLYDYYENDKEMKHKLLFQPFHIKAEDSIDSAKYADLEGGKLDIYVEAIIGFDKTTSNESVTSFCNFTHTIEGGCHVTGARLGIGNFFLDIAKQNMNKKELEKLEPTIDDARNGLYLVINLFTKKPAFVGQNKEKVGNDDLTHKIKNMIYSELDKLISKDKKVIDIITKYVKKCAEQRKRQANAKELALKDLNIGSNSFFDLPAKLTDISDRDGKYWGSYELYLVEGDSASSSCVSARVPQLQAIYPLRGVVLNTYKASTQKVIANTVFQDLNIVMGCGVKDHYDPSKCRWGKIIIDTDPDTDGDKIYPLLATYFLLYYPKLVEEGKLYRAIIPLYQVKYKGKLLFIRDKSHLTHMMVDNIENENVNISYSGVNLNRNDIFALVYKNMDYIYELEKLAEFFYMNETNISEITVEYLVYIISNYRQDFKTMKKLIEKKLDSVTVEKEDDSIIVSGVHNKEYVYFVYDDIAAEMSRTLVDMMFNVNNGLMVYTLNDDKNILLGELLYKLNKYRPQIMKRFKGLGELDWEELRDVSMIGTKDNPRMLEQLTVKDLQQTTADFNIIHGNDIEARKKLMTNYVISRENIDN